MVNRPDEPWYIRGEDDTEVEFVPVPQKQRLPLSVIDVITQVMVVVANFIRREVVNLLREVDYSYPRHLFPPYSECISLIQLEARISLAFYQPMPIVPVQEMY